MEASENNPTSFNVTILLEDVKFMKLLKEKIEDASCAKIESQKIEDASRKKIEEPSYRTMYYPVEIDYIDTLNRLVNLPIYIGESEYMDNKKLRTRREPILDDWRDTFQPYMRYSDNIDDVIGTGFSDPMGVALASIKALHTQVTYLSDIVTELSIKVRENNVELGSASKQIVQLEKEVHELKQSQSGSSCYER